MPSSNAIVELMSVPPQEHDLDWLKRSLQAAVQLEFATIPPYLTAYWSVEDPGEDIAAAILQVALDEMLHMGLACNMLTGLGETPMIATPGVVPNYPGMLPGGVHPDLIVTLGKLSRESALLFTQIELPVKPLGFAETFPTIGAFYDAVRTAFVTLAPPLSDARQIARPNFKLAKITTIDQATAAIDLIRHQGEGSETSPAGTDPNTWAHYYRFKEIATGHRLVQDPVTGKVTFTGADVPLPAVFPMADIPAGGYQRADVSADVAEKLDAFDQAYTTMLNQLQAAWQTGTSAALSQAVNTMRDLGDLATALMTIPIPGGAGHYGPCFRLITAQPPPVPNPAPGPLSFAANVPPPAADAASPPIRGISTRPHGLVRGLDKVPRSPSTEGRFGRMFRSIPAASFTVDDLGKLAGAMVAEHEDDPTPETESDNEENFGIDAGFTYLGQFIDHDLTFDPASSLQKQNDPEALVDFRTPRFDLDNVYGRGPDDQPYLYSSDGVRFLLGRDLTGNPNDPRPRDLQRNSQERALIGDPRNDENVIVSQIQAAMMRFHNRVADVRNASGPGDFEAVQEEVRWHYQWVVVNDFLRTVIGMPMLTTILPHLATTDKTVLDLPAQLKFYEWTVEPFMPLEFSVAAYRFGHSMVRPIYRLNRGTPRLTIFSNEPNTSLVGFRAFPASWAIEWELFFRLKADSPRVGADRLQPAYKIDSSLVNPLGALPSSIATGIPSLAERNLLRGLRMGLPSGQGVAKWMGIDPIPDESLRVGKATVDDAKANRPLTDLSTAFAGNAPLWYYVLAEAQQAYQSPATTSDEVPITLGPVGGRIVGETFVGLLLGDNHSYLRQQPGWKPRPEFTRDGKFGMAELLLQSMKA